MGGIGAFILKPERCLSCCIHHSNPYLSTIPWMAEAGNPIHGYSGFYDVGHFLVLHNSYLVLLLFF